MSKYHKYAPDRSKLVVLSYVDDFVYCYTSEELGNWFMDTSANILYMNFLGYPHWVTSISISQLRDHSILVYQARYATYVVAKYLDTATIKENSKSHKTTLPYDIILTKEDDYTSD